MEINNIDQLEQIILKGNLTDDQVSNVLYATLGTFPPLDITDRKELAIMVREFLKKYPKKQERPFFMVDLMSYSDEELEQRAEYLKNKESE